MPNYCAAPLLIANGASFFLPLLCLPPSFLDNAENPKMRRDAEKKALSLSLVPWLAAFGTSHFIAAPPSPRPPIGRAQRLGRSRLAALPRGNIPLSAFSLLGDRR